MRMRFLSSKWLTLSVGFCLLPWGVGSCGSGTPPASIPAPVSALIYVSSPDDNGLVTVTGTAGAVEANALVTVRNTSAAEAHLLDLFIPPALAQDSATTTAAADGSFSTQVSAAAGDTISVTQTVGGETSSAFETTVIAGQDILANAPVATSLFPLSNVGFVAHTDGTDTFIEAYSLSTLANTATGPVSGVVVTDFDVDNGSGEYYLVDQTNGQAVVLKSDLSVKGAALPVTAPVTVAASFGDEFGVMGHQSATNSITVIDSTADAAVSADSTLLITHPTAASAHQSTFALSLDDTVAGSTTVAALSTFANGDTILSLITATSPPGSTLVLGTQVNLGASTFDDVVLFGNASEVLVSNRSGDTVIHLTGAGLATQTTISVGDEPRGMAVDETNGEAYVANFSGNTVSVINLSTNTVLQTLTTADGVGLGPFDLSIDTDPSVVLIVANQTSQSVSVFSP